MKYFELLAQNVDHKTIDHMVRSRQSLLYVGKLGGNPYKRKTWNQSKTIINKS